MLRMRKKTVTVRDGMICDACEREMGDVEADDALSFRDTGGFSAPWGDGVTVGVDLCPDCVVTILGRWLKRDPDGPHREAFQTE